MVSAWTGVLVANIVTLLLATTFVVFRFMARRLTRVQLWWDDYMCAAAYFFTLVWTFVMFYWLFAGGLGLTLAQIGRDVAEVTEQSTILMWNAELFYAFSLACSKFAILGFYWRLFKTSNIRVPIIVMAVLSMIWLIIRTFMTIFHCVPVQAFWDASIENKVCNIDNSKFFFGSTLTHCLLDVIILALPVFQIKSLKLKTGQKVAVIGLFMFGILVCAASLVLCIEATMIDNTSPELPQKVSPIMLWATVEVNFAIVSACLPMIRPVIHKFTPVSFLKSNPSASYTGRGGTLGTSSKGAIKLTSIARVVETVDDTSSTRNLAGREGDDTSNHSNDYEQGTFKYGENFYQTKVSGNTRDNSSMNEHEDAYGAAPGIRVKNETTVHYEQA